MTAMFTASTYEAIPEGIYPAQLLGIEKLPSEAFGEFLKWSFRLRLADGNTSDLSAASSTSTGPKSKAYKWAAVLLGHAPAPGAAEDLTGKVCQLHVIVNEDGFNRVEALLPKSASATAPAVVFEDSPPAKLAPAADLPF
jgi:hypothetical protein